MENGPHARVSNEVLAERVENLKETVNKGFADLKLAVLQLSSEVAHVGTEATETSRGLKDHLREVELVDDPRLETTEHKVAIALALAEDNKLLLQEHLTKHGDEKGRREAKWEVLGTVDRILLRLLAFGGGLISLGIGVKELLF